MSMAIAARRVSVSSYSFHHPIQFQYAFLSLTLDPQSQSFIAIGNNVNKVSNARGMRSNDRELAASSMSQLMQSRYVTAEQIHRSPVDVADLPTPTSTRRRRATRGMPTPSLRLATVLSKEPMQQQHQPRALAQSQSAVRLHLSPAADCSAGRPCSARSRRMRHASMTLVKCCSSLQWGWIRPIPIGSCCCRHCRQTASTCENWERSSCSRGRGCNRKETSMGARTRWKSLRFKLKQQLQLQPSLTRSS